MILFLLAHLQLTPIQPPPMNWVLQPTTNPMGLIVSVPL